MQDVASSALLKSNIQMVTDIRSVNLDIRANSMLRNMEKPSLADKIAHPGKQQFKPVMASKNELDRGPEDGSDLGLGLEPLPSVKLRMGP